MAIGGSSALRPLSQRLRGLDVDNAKSISLRPDSPVHAKSEPSLRPDSSVHAKSEPKRHKASPVNAKSESLAGEDCAIHVAESGDELELNDQDDVPLSSLDAATKFFENQKKQADAGREEFEADPHSFGGFSQWRVAVRATRDHCAQGQ